MPLGFHYMKLTVHSPQVRKLVYLSEMHEENYDPILGGAAHVLRASREPCLVCGHPTGDCRGEQKSPAPQDTLGANIFPSLDGRKTFLVKQDVYEESSLAGGITMRILVVKAGTEISYRKARELGLL